MNTWVATESHHLLATRRAFPSAKAAHAWLTNMLRHWIHAAELAGWRRTTDASDADTGDKNVCAVAKLGRYHTFHFGASYVTLRTVDVHVWLEFTVPAASTTLGHVLQQQYSCAIEAIYKPHCFVLAGTTLHRPVLDGEVITIPPSLGIPTTLSHDKKRLLCSEPEGGLWYDSRMRTTLQVDAACSNQCPPAAKLLAHICTGSTAAALSVLRLIIVAGAQVLPDQFASLLAGDVLRLTLDRHIDAVLGCKLSSVGVIVVECLRRTRRRLLALFFASSKKPHACYFDFDFFVAMEEEETITVGAESVVVHMCRTLWCVAVHHDGNCLVPAGRPTTMPCVRVEHIGPTSSFVYSYDLNGTGLEYAVRMLFRGANVRVDTPAIEVTELSLRGDALDNAYFTSNGSCTAFDWNLCVKIQCPFPDQCTLHMSRAGPDAAKLVARNMLLRHVPRATEEERVELALYEIGCRVRGKKESVALSLDVLRYFLNPLRRKLIPMLNHDADAVVDAVLAPITKAMEQLQPLRHVIAIAIGQAHIRRFENNLRNCIRQCTQRVA